MSKGSPPRCCSTRKKEQRCNSKDSNSFLTDLVANLDEAVEVIDEQEKLGVKSSDLLQKTLESAENAPITNTNLEKLKGAGVEDTIALQSLISEPANSDEAAEFIDDALAGHEMVLSLPLQQNSKP